MGVSAYRFSERLWRTIGRMIGPFVGRVLDKRAARGKENPDRLPERFGHAALPRPEGPLLWIHAASVGELNSVLPLLVRLLDDRPELGALVTTGTVTSATLAARILPARAVHQFVPVDLPGAVDRFLNHWRPDLAFFVDSEFWPGLIGGLAVRGVPLVLVNGRVTEGTVRQWARASFIMRTMMERFTLLLAQSPEDADRLIRLGAPRDRVKMLGNLKTVAQPLRADAGEYTRLSAMIGGRPCWIAAATHPGEEAQAALVHARVMQRGRDLLTIIVPRHPDRGAAIAADLARTGLNVGLRSRGDQPERQVQVYVADTLGELGLWYRLAELVFIGGTLVAHGGQNPLEAARLGRALVFGPHMENFTAIVAGLREARACREVADAQGLAATVETLLFDDVALRGQLAQAARAHAEAATISLDVIVGALDPLLDRLPRPRPAARPGGR